MKNEGQVPLEADTLGFQAIKWSLKDAEGAAPPDLHAFCPRRTELITVHAGKTDPVHKQDPAKSWGARYSVPLEGQTDILITRHPVHLAVQRELQRR